MQRSPAVQASGARKHPPTQITSDLATLEAFLQRQPTSGPDEPPASERVERRGMSDGNLASPAGPGAEIAALREELAEARRLAEEANAAKTERTVNVTIERRYFMALFE